jgi:tRNA pseudouridine38-40 synthase
VRWAKAHPSFHARSSAVGKTYRYDFSAFVTGAADWERARAALRGLEGLQRLDGLCSPSKQHKPAPPLGGWTVSDAGVLEEKGKAFRKHQVRNLAGHLAAVALGYAQPESLRELAARTRPWMGAQAPAHGLTLVEVHYPPPLDPFTSPAASSAKPAG